MLHVQPTSEKNPRMGNGALQVVVDPGYPSGYAPEAGVQEKRERRMSASKKKVRMKYANKSASGSKFRRRREEKRLAALARDPANPLSPNHIATSGKAAFLAAAGVSDDSAAGSSGGSGAGAGGAAGQGNGGSDGQGKGSAGFTLAPNGLKRTTLFDLHVRRGGKMVEFAGWEMPVLYQGPGALSVMQSHLHTRQVASLFDVSHMCQLKLSGALRVDFLESLIVGDLRELKPDHARLTLFTNENGGIMDDSVVTVRGDHIFFVVNAGCADKDVPHIRKHLAAFKEEKGSEADDLVLEELNETRGLVALQGPKAEEVLANVLGVEGAGVVKGLAFMSCGDAVWQNEDLIVSRCGYTGEDGFEISVPHSIIDSFVETLLAQPISTSGGEQRTMLAGLGARDSLRLEAGLCLYGNDMDEDVTPVEATLLWTVSKSRRQPGSFLGSEKILSQIADKKSARFKRIGFTSKGPPARQGSKIYEVGAAKDAAPIGTVTSGTFSPVLKHGVGMAHVDLAFQKAGTEFEVEVRGKRHAAKAAKMPFVPAGYKS